MSPAPARIWWTAAEIAEARLPDLPSTTRGVDALAKRLGWRSDPVAARRRAGRGGGWEYAWTLFPASAKRRLLQEARAAGAAVPQGAAEDRDAVWAAFDAQPEKVKTAARARLATLQRVQARVEAGATKFAAIGEVARLDGVSAKTIWNWFALVEGARADDWLARLAPRHGMARRAVRQAEVSPEVWDQIKSDYLRPAQPSFTSCYRRAVRVAAAQGWSIPDERTLRRRLEREVSRATQVLARKGVDALKTLYPPQTRDKTALRALEVVNADFHRFDVFVRWPAGRGESEGVICRPQMVAFQDVHSGRILSFRVDQTPNAETVRLCAGDMIETWGIPDHVVLDNGREFASKHLTGGAPTRYRFKVREDDIPGLFVTLGCEIHWATPYSGQSKPVERAFRDLCDAIAKDPRFDGAWTGNNPMAKPEDYGSRAVDLDVFLRVLADGIEEHNTRRNRRSEVAYGRSFAEVFDASYATAPIRKATEAQRRLWLMGAEGLRADSRTGMVRFQGNEYWADWMADVAGERLIARFDPADLWSGLHIYSAENAYLGFAPCKDKSGFLDVVEARAHSRARRAWMAAEKAAMAAHRRLSAAEIGASLDALAPLPAPAGPAASVIRPVFGRSPQPTPADPAVDRAQAAIVAELAERRPSATAPEEARDRFRRALDIEAAEAAGATVTPEQRRWLAAYQGTPEYRAERTLWETWGDQVFG